MNYLIILLGGAGFLLSMYALYVEHATRRNKMYRAACDISQRMSCTKAFGGRYGKTLGISNSIYGLIFYGALILLAILGNVMVVFFMSVLSLLGTVYLAYVLFTKVKTFCIVCTAVYLINLFIFILSYRAFP